MTVSRQPSTTSLGRYVRSMSPMPQGERNSDFCNTFWGVDDVGVGVLFTRMRGAMRTMEELRNFWKERAAIEDDYARRLGKLAKYPLGKDEIGDIRNCLEIVVLETQNQSKFHSRLAYTISKELEAKAAQFHTDQGTHKKSRQNPVEKAFKAKQAQEGYVNKAREKYEQDCVRINSFTAQSTLVQGKELEKITLKLERAKQTVQANNRDYVNFSKAYADTAAKWEQEWKTFCDSCQDTEEERLEFIKDSLWGFANVVSAVCVFDDNSCEKLRIALEEAEVERDMENFVRDYGTGSQIPDPPALIDYNRPDTMPSSSSDMTFHLADFVRVARPHKKRKVSDKLSEDDPPKTKRDDLQRQASRRSVASSVTPPPVVEEEPKVNMAGLGAGGSRQATEDVPSVNGTSSPIKTQVERKPTAVSRKPPQDPTTESNVPTTQTFMKVGNNAYPVDVSRDPQEQGGPSTSIVNNQSPTKGLDTEDPLAKTLAELNNAVSTQGSARRNSMWRTPQNVHQPQPRAAGAPLKTSGTSPAFGGPSRQATLASPSRPGSSASTAPRDYRNSADIVVGAHPTASRPVSPNPGPSNPPTAAFMKPRNSLDPAETEAIKSVLTDYHQSLPGERKSISRRGSYNAPSPSPSTEHQQQVQNLGRPPSQMGHAGVGAHGSRSNSPQPLSRGPSPAPGYIPAPPAPSIQRSASPNNVGIALDPSGRVLHDDMAQRYQHPHQHQQQHQPQQQRPLVPQQPPPPPIQQQAPSYTQPVQRRGSYMSMGPAIPPPPPPVQPTYTPGPPTGYTAPPPAPVPVSTYQMQYSAPPPAQYQAPMQQQVFQPQPQMYGNAGQNGMQRATSAASGPYYANGTPAPGRQMHVQAGSGYQQPASVYGRSPSPQPPPPPAPPQEETPFLFYVKALYDYTATIDEEFDFQAGDVIAVTATPEDGWWSGHLLDDARSQPGRHIFPSNFVCLF
ncbi:SH3 domain-containing protein [Armillaria luteobubalina]|uniref:SH3 domain-containing protein n=1 Tax=Armillaria luteobubalina TaxID=153913 RepID=A0AA39ULL1_9AGAR|nr:SH3 domain-containing protein [Armillaria luteobubalina]